VKGASWSSGTRGQYIFLLSGTLDFLEAFFHVKMREAPDEHLQLPWAMFQSGRDPGRASELNPLLAASVMNLFSYS